MSNIKSNANSSLHKKTIKESARVQEYLLRVQSILEEQLLSIAGLGDNLSLINTSAGDPESQVQMTEKKLMGKKKDAKSTKQDNLQQRNSAGMLSKPLPATINNSLKYARKGTLTQKL